MTDVAITIAVTVLEPYAVGDTVKERFDNLMRHRNDACWMCHTEEQEFRSVLAALVISYPLGSEERTRLEAEVRNLQLVSLMMQGIHVKNELEEIEPYGLLGWWHKGKTS